MALPKASPCPKCGRVLKSSGEITADDGTRLASFQCDECIEMIDFGGTPVETALTFAVREDGSVVRSQNS